jgi:hypothetical protein
MNKHKVKHWDKRDLEVNSSVYPLQQWMVNGPYCKRHIGIYTKRKHMFAE